MHRSFHTLARWVALALGFHSTRSAPSANGLAPSPFSSIPEYLKPFCVTHEGKRGRMANGITAGESFQLGVLRRVDAQGEPLAGYMRVHVVDLAEIRNNIRGLRAAAREGEAVLSKLSVLFEETENLSPRLYKETGEQFLVNDHSGNGCWLPRRDFWNATAILIDFVHVAINGWEKELTWLASKLFEYE
ncbi:hypothetical protein FB45DRAFT_860126 [Roridomyces roridus]|uniref:Uncharacterized protein n=1 Tax=Roridomyces roridus TaxID=1738132 RepID=A0AAD7FVZ5_9AGAR|nr:hypothetical protein FB45DRAFT_860126 [Roridomyces roridus]